MQTLSLMLMDGSVPRRARGDMDACLAAVLEGAENTLRPDPDTPLLHPFGLVMDADGVLRRAAQYEADYTYDETATAATLHHLADDYRTRAAELRCATIAYYVRMKEPSPGDTAPVNVQIRRSTDWQNGAPTTPPGTVDAVAMEVEHQAGCALAVFMPYAWQGPRQEFVVGDLMAVPGKRRVWPDA
ncbi:hypothetical protein NE236_05320 [Actinoallomurus purpureus]|uniref:hypothetical protein n=1 Tax=Actinoallomurus purpureus TaxID=478114 RepID=UPI0020924BA6|nr:hypothetical protein [Actinoallomurus purpureus]MCO6004396.1 hypothetical protein [Actinoallomurus purpureus]